ncbi:GntR family transcriptional regulator [Glaciihabitans sp. INWT7]|uniref:GntR family transcriptional regulator n=1 Tax=Glaciihabitans sp. INWT7 TaxID=2596912 RepID=UPI0016240D89|nr:GntR family transcriptional regulator [Glaciihabitans sp. INWT7]QNE46212.1 GntR family transcriptional regulator [Glaciihabitans sp. INWT7]
MPAFEQIRSQLATLIFLGTLPSEVRLPPVRQLATDLRVAPGTVARAYAMLESEGLVTTGGRAGTKVSVQADNFPEVLDSAIDFVETARARHLDLDRTILALQAAWKASENPPIK